MENTTVHSNQIKSKDEIPVCSEERNPNDGFVGNDTNKIKAAQELLQIDDCTISKMIDIENSHGYSIPDQITDLVAFLYECYLKNRFRKRKVLIPQLHLSPFRDTDCDDRNPGNFKLPFD